MSTHPDPFVRDLTRVLLAFFAVVAIDRVVVSMITGKLRFWFPLWLDPGWEVGPGGWVVYSQSYLFKEVSVVGANGCGIEEVDGTRKHGFSVYLNLLADGRLDTAGLISHHFPLSEAFTTALDKGKHRSQKVVFDFAL